MRRRLVIGLVLVAIAGAFFFVRSSLNPAAIRGAAEARLSTLLGQPVSIGSVSISMFPVPAVIGSNIAVGPERERPELSLDRIRIVPRLRSLFGGAYVVREVVLEGLTVGIVRELRGQWKFPSLIPAPGGDAGRGLVVESVRLRGGRVRVFESSGAGALRETSAIEDVEGEAVAVAGGLELQAIRGRIGGSAIAGNASVNEVEARVSLTMPEIRGDDVPAVLGLAAAEPPAFVGLPKPASASFEVRFDRANSRLSGSGSLRAPEVSFYSLTLNGFEAPMETDGVRLRFAPATFTLYGGAHRGEMVVDLSTARARWALDSHVSGLDVGRFLSALAGGDQRIAGTGAAAATLNAFVGDALPQGLAGRMQVTIANGVIREFPLLAAINRTLRLAEGEGRDTKFERLSATLAFAARGSAATTNDLSLQAREVQVKAAGRIGFDRSLDLSGVAILSPDRSAPVVRSIRELAALRNDRGELELPLRISGTLDDPSFAIDLKAAVGRTLKHELQRRIRDLFRREPGDGAVR
jgi:hypothetical protein